MYNPLLERLDKGPLVCDGGMGSLLFASGIPYQQCYEELNVSRADLIQSIHRDYIAAGAEIIETNSFGANRFKLAEHGYADKVRAFNMRAAKVAREARDVAGEDVFVAGAVGPLGQSAGPSGAQNEAVVKAAFKEQIEALVEGGVDLIMLETFYDFTEMCTALSTARSITDMPVVAQMIFTEEGKTFSGHDPAQVMQMLSAQGADVIGINCHIGPQGSLAVVEKLRGSSNFPYLSAQPNAGVPARFENRMFYSASPEYFASYAPRFIEAGVKLLGGCCGTTPEHIAAIRQSIKDLRPAPARNFVVPQPTPNGAIYSPVHSGDNGPQDEADERKSKAMDKVLGAEPTKLAQALAGGKFVVSVELTPPKGLNPTKMLQGAAQMAELGADFVNISDSAMARVAMSSISCAMLVQNMVGIETIIHFTSRDRNLMALQSDLIGAHANGIRNVLALTGDPPRMGDYPGARAIWDVDSVGLVGILKRFNDGMDWSGNSTGRAANFAIGCAFEPTAQDLPAHLEKLHRKIDAGAHYIMTQPCFDARILRESLQEARDRNVPVIAGLMTLSSYKQAEYIANEVPGIDVPASVLQRMHDAGEKGSLEGLKICAEMVEQIGDFVQGIYIYPGRGKYDAGGELVKLLKQ